MASLDGTSELQEAVGERGFSVIDVGDDGEVSNPLWGILAQINGTFTVVLARMSTVGKSGAKIKGRRSICREGR